MITNIAIWGKDAVLTIPCKGVPHSVYISKRDLQAVIGYPYAWHIVHNLDGRAYVCADTRTSGSAKSVKLHRFLLGVTDKKIEVDHRDGDGLNNRRINLRPLTKAQNQCNRHAANRNSQTGVRGVGWHKLVGKWQARVRVDNNLIQLGWYDSVEEAKQAVDAFWKQFWYKQEQAIRRVAS